MKKNKIVFLLALVFPLSTLASIIHVPGDQPTIQAGIDAAVNGDTVLVADGTYTGVGNRDIDFNGKAITVQSENGADFCIIDCEGTEADSHRGFKFHSGEGNSSVLQGFTIKNGYADGPDFWEDCCGGGIYCYFSSPTITECFITENDTDPYGLGGGICCTGQSLAVIKHNTIASNSGGQYGGGIHCHENADPVIAHNVISGNYCDIDYSFGGGICCYESSPTIVDNEISWNLAGLQESNIGGGISCRDNSNPVIQGNRITNNSASTGGGIDCRYSCSPLIKDNEIAYNISEAAGGIFWDYRCRPIINSNMIIGNDATSHSGGGIYGTRDIQIFNNLIVGNTAHDYGGGIYGWYAFFQMRNNTIVGNRANQRGGGICLDRDSYVVITNSIFWGNSAPHGREIYLGSASRPSTLDISYSDVDGGLASTYIDTNCTLSWGNEMIDVNPLFMTGPQGDYYLLQPVSSGLSLISPCVDSGDPGAWMINGTTRIDEAQDFGIIDMGYHYPDDMSYVGLGNWLEETPDFGDEPQIEVGN